MSLILKLIKDYLLNLDLITKVIIYLKGKESVKARSNKKELKDVKKAKKRRNNINNLSDDDLDSRL